jgi:Icc protein
MRQRFFASSFERAGNKSDTCELSPLNGANRENKMTHKKQDLIDQKSQDLNHDGIDRRGFLKCMAWAGTGLVWTMSGGIPVSRAFAKGMDHSGGKGGDFSFVQISDSHMGFNKPANPDVVATLQAAVDKINGLVKPPEFLLHTGDISHLSRPEQFDTVDQVLKGASTKDVFFGRTRRA